MRGDHSGRHQHIDQRKERRVDVTRGGALVVDQRQSGAALDRDTSRYTLAYELVDQRLQRLQGLTHAVRREDARCATAAVRHW